MGDSGLLDLVTPAPTTGEIRPENDEYIELVRAAMAVRMISASWIGKFGSTPSRMWSQAQIDSKPSCSMRTPYSISSCAEGISGYLVKFRIAMPNSVVFFAIWCGSC